MSEKEVPSGERPRSPSFPYVDLKEAVSRARKIYDQDGKGETSKPALASHWGFKSPGSSSFLRTLAALGAFGLISGKKGRYRLTPSGLRILLDSNPDSPDRKEAIQKAALSPKAYKELFTEIDGHLPSDVTLRTKLLLDRGFTEASVDKFIGGFKKTLTYAGLLKDGTIDSVGEGGEDGSEPEDASPEGASRPKLRVGDLVQWESQGVLQFPRAVTVLGFTEDGEWVFVEGSETGLPVSQLTLVESAKKEPPMPETATLKPPASPHTPVTPPPLNPFSQMPGFKQDVFTLNSGDVTLRWPSSLTEEEFEDLSAWLDLMQKKVKRSVDA